MSIYTFNNDIRSITTTDSSSILTGALTSAGGLGISKSLYVGTGTNLATVSGITTIGSSTALTVSATGVLTVANTTASSSTITGSVILSGGIGIAGALFGSTSSFSGSITTGSDLVFSTDAIIRRNTTDATDNGFLTITGGGGDANTRGGRIVLSGNERSSLAGDVELIAGNVATGEIVLNTGGTNRLTIGNNGDIVSTGSHLYNTENTSIIIDSGSDRRLGLVKKSGTGPYFAIGSGHQFDWRVANNVSIQSVATTTYTSLATLTTTNGGSLNVLGTATIGSSNTYGADSGAINAGGHITLSNGSSNMIAFRQIGVNAPAFSTRSAGTKLVLYPNLGVSDVDYAIGIESVTMWFSVPNNTTRFRWYAGTTPIASLSGTGVFTATGTTASTSNATGSLLLSGGIATTNTTDAVSSTNGGTFTTAGGAAIAKKLFVGTDLSVGGALSKGSGTFDIEHPLHKNKRLVHSFIEGPRCDNIYRGSVCLIDGTATIDLDKDCVSSVECEMSPGTFEALNQNIDFFLQNKSTFDQLLGRIIDGKLIIWCNNPSSCALVSWMVIAERKDTHIKQWSMTNEDGNLITEHSV